MNEENKDIEIVETEVSESVVEEPKKARFLNKQMVALFLCTTLVSTGLGFAGGYVAYNLNDRGNGGRKEVLYQSVLQTKADGSDASGLSISDVFMNVKDSVVEITTSTVVNNPFMQQYVSSGAGSGVVVSTDGTIITNHHVIDGANDIKVRLADGSEYTATLVGSDAQSDLAVIRIEAQNLKPAILGDSSKLIVGEEVMAIGNPLGKLGGSLTNGIVSALDREITIDGQTMTLLQTNADINPGNSGGGLFNRNGELIGIVNAKSSGTDIEGIGFAIPVNIAKDIAEQLINNGAVSGRITLGIRYVEINDSSTAAMHNVNTLGLLVKEVVENSNASRAGIKANDIITAVDGEQVNTATELKAKLNAHEINDSMSITVLRDRQYIDIEVRLAE